MKQITTVCPRDCYDTCALIATVDNHGRIVSMRGDPTHPMTRGFVCPRGARDHHRLYKNRVEAPALRQGNALQRSDWDTCLNVVAQKLAQTLEKHGPDAVLHLNYAGNTSLLTFDFPQRLWNAIGATQTDNALCSQSGHQALALHYGERYGTAPEELLSMPLIVFWGFNAAVSSPHTWALAREARKSSGTQIVVVDPRASRTARGANLWIQPRPGSDVALAYGIIDYLIQNDHVDLNFVQRWTTGFKALEAAASPWALDRVEQITGVAQKHIQQLAQAYAELRPSSTMIGIGLQKCDQGADQVRAVAFIPALLGLHRGFFYSNGDAFSIDKALLSGRALTDNPPLFVNQVALADLVERGRVKFIYVTCMNPAMTLPNLHAFREGLSREDVFVAVHETHWTKTAQYADVVLPAPTYLEKDDLVLPWSHNTVQFSHQVVPPVTDSRSEVWVMREMARRLGLRQEWLYADPWVAVERALEGAFEQGDLQSLRSGEMLRLKRKPKNRYSTPSGRIEFDSSLASEMGLNPLPVQTPLHVEPGHFVWLTSATPQYTSTQFQEVYGPIPATVVINSRDAERLGIQDGQTVTLANDRGQVKVQATVSDAVPEGVVWSPRQSEGLAGEPQNALMSSVPQEIGGGPRFNSTTVTISTRPLGSGL